MRANDPRIAKRGYTFISIPVSWLEERPHNTLSHETLGVYVRLYLLAGRFNRSGMLEDEKGILEVSDLAYVLRCSVDELNKALQLLESYGLLTRLGKGWGLDTFTSEQVNLNELREEWRKRQAKKRKNDKEQETESKGKKDSDGEVEEDGHESIMRDNSVTIPQFTTTTNNSYFTFFRNELIRTLDENGEEINYSRLDDCLNFWQILCKVRKWRFRNKEAVLELYEEGVLEERIKLETNGELNIDKWRNPNDF